MRQYLSIALIVVFLLSQYGRNIAYLECELYNLVQQGTGIRCDCERMAPVQADTGKSPLAPLQKQGGVHLDESFLFPAAVLPIVNYVAPPLLQWPVAAQHGCQGFGNELLRPPQYTA